MDRQPQLSSPALRALFEAYQKDIKPKLRPSLTNPWGIMWRAIEPEIPSLFEMLDQKPEALATLKEVLEKAAAAFQAAPGVKEVNPARLAREAELREGEECPTKSTSAPPTA